MNIDTIYRQAISLAADKVWIADARRQGLKDSAAFFAKEAQAVRREMRAEGAVA